MDALQLLENKAAKLILDLPVWTSATEALRLLNWTPLHIRRHQIVAFLSLNVFMDLLILILISPQLNPLITTTQEEIMMYIYTNLK